jgi:adenylate kinase family enzyme
VDGRIYITGGSGSGKTTLAERLAADTGLTVHHLDEIAREGGGRGPERSASDRDHDVAAILATDRWIVEGVQLGWTEPLLRAADTIVWLDHVPTRRSSTRVVRRFASQALAEARQRRGRERFLRMRDYARKVRELAVSLPDTRAPRSDLAAALAPFEAKVVRCSTDADVAAFLEGLTTRA